MSARTAIVALTLLLGPTVPTVLAQHEHGHEEHGKPAEFKMPATYKDGVAEIQHRLHEIEELMEAKKLDQVHSQAEVIQKVGNIIGQLALKPKSGVPKEAIKDVNKAGRELAAKFDAIDKAGDSGDLAGTRKVHEEMRKLCETLERYLPKEYACPMRCEGDKTYPQPGKCPKCGMALKEVAARRGPHGGPLAWSADHKCGIEATLSKDNEVRIYLCDEKSKPLPADRVAAQAHAGKKGAPEPEHRPVRLTLDASKSFLSGKLDADTKTPLSIMLVLDFKDGKKSQSFDFEFDKPTAAAREEHKQDHGRHGDNHEGHKP